MRTFVESAFGHFWEYQVHWIITVFRIQIGNVPNHGTVSGKHAVEKNIHKNQLENDVQQVQPFANLVLHKIPRIPRYNIGISRFGKFFQIFPSLLNFCQLISIFSKITPTQSMQYFEVTTSKIEKNRPKLRKIGIIWKKIYNFHYLNFPRLLMSKSLICSIPESISFSAKIPRGFANFGILESDTDSNM